MNPLTNIYFRNGSYFQAFFKDDQLDESVTQFIAETALIAECFSGGTSRGTPPCTSHTGHRYACMKIRLSESQLGKQKLYLQSTSSAA